MQGRRRLFKSGPAEEAIECRRHERGDYSPSRKGGFGGPPPRKFLNFERFYVRFNGVLCVWDRILVVVVTIFCYKRYFLSHEKPNAGQNCFQTVTSYSTFFFSMFL